MHAVSCAPGKACVPSAPQAPLHQEAIPQSAPVLIWHGGTFIFTAEFGHKIPFTNLKASRVSRPPLFCARTEVC